MILTLLTISDAVDFILMCLILIFCGVSFIILAEFNLYYSSYLELKKETKFFICYEKGVYRIMLRYKKFPSVKYHMKFNDEESAQKFVDDIIAKRNEHHKEPTIKEYGSSIENKI